MDWNKYTIATLILAIILLTGCDEPPNTTQSAAVNSNKGNSTTVTADVQFRVMDLKSQPIENAKILIINGDGKVIHEETSDKNGIAQKKLTVPIDKRFYWADPNDTSTRGSVTVIAYKDGYRETVLFEVPVSPACAVQPLCLNALVPGGRNEPDVQLGNNHHLEILSLADKYNQYLKSRNK